MPFANEHACELTPNDGRYSLIRRVNCDPKRKHDGKCVDVVYGKRKSDGNMEDHSYRYAKEIWTASDARSHCNSKNGKFEPATNQTKGEASPLVADAMNRLKIMEGMKHAN